MIIFHYFFEKMDLFGPLMDKYAYGEQRHIDNEYEDMVSNYYVSVMARKN